MANDMDYQDSIVNKSISNQFSYVLMIDDYTRFHDQSTTLSLVAR